MDLFETGRIIFNLLTVGVVSLDGDQKPQADPRLDVIPRLVSDVAQKEFQLSAEQWKVISYIDGQRTINALVPLTGTPAKMIAPILKELQKLGFLRFSRNNGSSEKPVASRSTKDGQDSAGSKVEAYPSRVRAAGLD
jgi:hypothetical protein